MTVRLQIERIQPGNADEANEYVRLAGTSESGTRVVAVCFGPVAKALRLSLAELAGKDDFVDEVVERGVAVKLDGAFSTTEREVEGRRFRQTQFKASKFEILTGPSIELFRLRKNGAALLADSAALATAGDIASAYRKLEQFVAKIAGVDPHALVDELAIEDAPAPQPEPEPASNPELEAARRLLPEQEVASLTQNALPAEAPAQDLAPAADVEEVADLADPEPAEPSSTPDTPSVQEEAEVAAPEATGPSADANAAASSERSNAPAPLPETTAAIERPAIATPPPPIRRRPAIAGIPLAPPSGIRRPNLPRPAPRPAPPSEATEEETP